MSEARAVSYEAEIPEVLESLAGVHQVMDRQGLERTLHHLVLLRATLMRVASALQLAFGGFLMYVSYL